MLMFLMLECLLKALRGGRPWFPKCKKCRMNHLCACWKELVACYGRGDKNHKIVDCPKNALRVQVQVAQGGQGQQRAPLGHFTKKNKVYALYAR